jgi:ribose transport system ATP-binding protein
MPDAILRVEKINKDFGNGPVLKDVDLEVRPGEILGIIGENGAGKSTQMNILAGIHHPTSGKVCVDGKAVRIASPIHARSLKISLVPQEFNLIRNLSVYNNVFLGAELRKRGGMLDKVAMKARTRELLAQLNVTLDPEARIGGLSAAQKLRVEICKALAFDSRVLIMDEPTTMLTKYEIEILFRLVTKLLSEGMTILYISHKLKEVKHLCDRVAVFRDGELVHDGPGSEISIVEMARKMVGRELGSIFPAKGVPGTETVFEGRESRGYQLPAAQGRDPWTGRAGRRGPHGAGRNRIGPTPEERGDLPQGRPGAGAPGARGCGGGRHLLSLRGPAGGGDHRPGHDLRHHLRRPR